ncbi:MAG: glycosyltransferase family 4 protein [Pirellulales bacterium]
MRVLHIITRMIIGGAQENTLYNCLDLMRDYQDDVLLVTGPEQGPEGGLLDQGRAGGLPIHTADSLRRNIHLGHDWRARAELRSIIDEFKPDVVHTHSAKAGMIGRMVAWKARVPAVIHTVHGAPFHPYQSWAARRFFITCERAAARRCHHMISVADAMTDLMTSAGVAKREKFTTIYSGMDVEPFVRAEEHRAEARRELGFHDDDVVFGKIARLFHLKGHEYLIEAAEEVVRENPRCKFLLVGDGILRPQLEADLKARGLERSFVFAGLVPPERIPYCLGAMDALVHTSLREGLARTLPQALIAGRPVISYDVDGAREVVLPDLTGFLLPPKSIKPLTDSILKLAASTELRHRLGTFGAAKFVDQFRHQTMTRKIREVYQRVLNRSV